MNPTYEMSGAGSEHADKRQRQRLTNQLPIPHSETRSHDAAISTSLVWIVPSVKARSTRPGEVAAELVGSGHLLSVAEVLETAPLVWEIRAAYATERWLTLTPDRLDELDERIDKGARRNQAHDGPKARRPYPPANWMPPVAAALVGLSPRMQVTIKNAPTAKAARPPATPQLAVWSGRLKTATKPR
jgi:hypothetical protein